MQLLEWQNLIFMVPIGLGTLYLLMLAVGASAGDHGHAADVGHEPDLSADHDLSAEHALSAEHGLGLEHHAGLEHTPDAGHGGAEHEVHPSLLATLVGLLGIGKVPFSILLLSYCFVWGVAGLASNILLEHKSPWVAIAIAAGAAVVVTRHLALGLSRLIPSVESYHTPLRQLLGLEGQVLYQVTENSGVVRVRDQQDTLRDVSCRVKPGSPSIPAGTRVVLLSYDASTRTFRAEPVQGKESQ